MGVVQPVRAGHGLLVHDHEATYAGEFDDGLTGLGRSGTEHFGGSVGGAGQDRGALGQAGVGGPIGAYASRDL